MLKHLKWKEKLLSLSMSTQKWTELKTLMTINLVILPVPGMDSGHTQLRKNILLKIVRLLMIEDGEIVKDVIETIPVNVSEQKLKQDKFFLKGLHRHILSRIR